jgi:hypothetical protein
MMARHFEISTASSDSRICAIVLSVETGILRLFVWRKRTRKTLLDIYFLQAHEFKLEASKLLAKHGPCNLQTCG